MNPSDDPSPGAATSVKLLLQRRPRAILATLLLVVCTLAAAILLSGVLDLASFKTIGLNYETLKSLVAHNVPLAILAYIASYAMLAVFMLPGSAIFVVASGLLFGIAIGIPLSIFASTLAATLAFLVARSTFGRRLSTFHHPMFESLKAGFARHELGYMLFLRLTPGLPFAGVNFGTGLLGVSLRSFVIGTFAGFIPSRIALSTAGASLGQAINLENAQYSQCLARASAESSSCPYSIHIASLLTKETLAAFVALAFLALVPAIMDQAPRLWRRLRT